MFLALAAAAAALALPAAASAELARARLCTSCHHAQGKLVGPGFRDIAARYAGQPEAAPRLAAKIRAGGAGSWGVVPMPANPKVTPEEARQLADWVLATK